jgi:hypothetical protein
MSNRHMMKLERKREPLLTPREFAGRMARTIAVVTAFVTTSLIVGMAGYHFTEGLAWIDAFANASMILSGMGPLDAPKTNIGKLFAGFYALYSGLAVLVAAAVLLTPVIHRMIHRFHLDDDKPA